MNYYYLITEIYKRSLSKGAKDYKKYTRKWKQSAENDEEYSFKEFQHKANLAARTIPTSKKRNNQRANNYREFAKYYYGGDEKARIKSKEVRNSLAKDLKSIRKFGKDGL